MPAMPPILNTIILYCKTTRQFRKLLLKYNHIGHIGILRDNGSVFYAKVVIRPCTLLCPDDNWETNLG
jgi:hypothetical protein